MLKLCVLLGALTALASSAEPTSHESDAPRSDESTADDPARAGSWGCTIAFLEEDDRLYCLATCDGPDEFDPARPAFRRRVRLGDVSDDWCPDKARQYCQRRGLELDYSCWGDYSSW